MDVITIPKTSNKIRSHIRLTPSVDRSARKIAKEDYNSESKLSQVIEDSLTHYIAFRENKDSLEVVLSATEGALYQRVKEKFEKEFDSFTNRVSGLVAKSGFEATLNTLLMEDVFYKQKGSKERYEELRGVASRRLRKRLDDAGSPETLELLEQNKKLEEENQKVKTLAIKSVKEKEKQIKDLEGKLEETKKQAKEIDRYYQEMIQYISKHQEKSFTGKTTLPKTIEELANQFTSKR